MKAITTAIEFFSEEELKCKGDGTIKLDPRFAKALPELRRKWGMPLTPTSVCRTPQHNAKVGGNPRSLHLTENPKWQTFGTMAADISWRDWHKEKKLMFAKTAWEMGWSIGLHNGFCHIDRRSDAGLNQSVFLYGEWDNEFEAKDIT